MGLQNQFDDLSGNLQLDYQSADNAISGNLVSTGQSLLSTIDDLSGTLNDTGQHILDVAVTGEGISGMHRKTITFRPRHPGRSGSGCRLLRSSNCPATMN